MGLLETKAHKTFDWGGLEAVDSNASRKLLPAVVARAIDFRFLIDEDRGPVARSDYHGNS